MPNTKLGKVSVTPRGEYQSTTDYTRLDVVAYNGGSYIALRDVTGITPVNGADWMQIAERGATGAQGVQGQQGAQGNPGATVETDGLYGFSVNADGHLILTYTGVDAPDFSVNADGHLIYNF